MKDRGVDQPVEKSTTHHADRAPSTEVHEGHGDEAHSLGEVRLEDAQLENQGCTRASCHRIGDEDRCETGSLDGNTEAVCRTGVLTDRPDVEAERGPSQQENGGGYQKKCEVGQEVSLEQRGSQVRYVRQHRNVDVWQTPDRFWCAHLTPEEQAAESQTEDVDADAANALCRVQDHSDEAVEESHH